MKFYLVLCFTCFLLTGGAALSQTAFSVVPLGIKGGMDKSNLSAYLVAVAGTNEYLCLDAGTLRYGIQKAVDAGVFTTGVKEVQSGYIKAYLISHGHLDHVAGLIINAPEDTAKNIYGLPFCLNVLKEKYFTWQAWANFGNEGEKPFLNKYHYFALTPGSEVAIERTTMYVTAFALSHSNPYQSTAFLIRHQEDYLLYLGDTGADEMEKSDRLHRLWQRIQPLVKAGKLKALFIEVSFPDEQPAAQLFGHITPHLLMQEMEALSQLAGIDAMKALPVVITHMKPSGDQEERIRKQLAAANSLPLHLVFPAQAIPMRF